jgi:hypothetical protein
MFKRKTALKETMGLNEEENTSDDAKRGSTGNAKR